MGGRALETIQYNMQKSKLGGALKGIRDFPLKPREKSAEGGGWEECTTMKEIRGGIVELLQKAAYRTPSGSDGEFEPVPRTKERSVLYSLIRVAGISHHLV